MALDDAGAKHRGDRGHRNTALVTGIADRDAVFAQLVHEAQVNIFEGGGIGAVAVQQGKLRAVLF